MNLNKSVSSELIKSEIPSTSANRLALVTRYGGAGDLIMMLPTLKKLREKHGRLILRTYKDYAGLFECVPYVDGIVLDDNRFQLFTSKSGVHVAGAGLSFASAGDEITHYNLQGVPESRMDVHCSIADAEACGLVLGEDWKPSLPSECFDRIASDPYIAVQLRDRGDGRDLSLYDFSPTFIRQSWVKVTQCKMPDRDYFNLIANAAVFIGPDSSGVHIATATGVSEIYGFYIPEFPPSIRSYPGVHAFIGRSQIGRIETDLLQRFGRV